MRKHKRVAAPLALALLATIVSLAVASSAGATFLPGPNGDITFTSGRAPQNSDNNARIWVTKYPSGPVTQVTTLPAATQHRHPNWSPDHTKIVYAAGAAFSGTYALWIKDLETGSQTEFVPAAAGQDRPSWSPDGTKIAYAAGGDIIVKGVAPGSTPVSITTGAPIDERPVWSPDGNALYFNRGAVNARDIHKVTPVAPGGTVSDIVVSAATDDWQPAISPDGSKVCFLRGPQSDGADLYTANTSGNNSGVAVFSASPGVGDLNCMYSPDGTKIGYTRGAFGAGQLVEKNIDGSGFRVISDVATYFDGNGDWAQNEPPTCPNAGPFDVGFNSFLTITLPECTDPEGADVERELVAQPQNGNLGTLNNGTVTYTPNKDFQGADAFTYKGNDGTSDSNTATVSLDVAGPPATPGAGEALRVTGLRMSPRRWRRGRGRPVRLSAAKVGTTISYRLTKDARVKFSFSRAARGRRAGGRCRKATRRNRSRRRCTRWVKAGSFRLNGESGRNRVRFKGRLSGRKRLRLGRHRLVLAARDSSGKRSTSKRVKFRVVRR